MTRIARPSPFAFLKGQRFGVIYADPPWSFQARSPKGEGRAPSKHYRVMKMAELKAIPVHEIADDNCHLFMWTTAPHLEQAFHLAKAWGFRYSSVAFDWIKTHTHSGELFYHRDSFALGLGHTTRKNAEYCLLFRKGQPKRHAKDVRSLLVSPVREHSRKPDEAYERIERYCGPDASRIELFSRTDRQGWATAFSDQAGLFKRGQKAKKGRAQKRPGRKKGSSSLKNGGQKDSAQRKLPLASTAE